MEKAKAESSMTHELDPQCPETVRPENVGCEASFIPLLFSAGFGSDAKMEQDLARFFDGPLPEVGDAVELVCYERTPGNVMMKWRVRK
jgi:hypothetical protein